MRIINTLEDLNIAEKTSVALGNFDGIHVGHCKIMEDAINTAKESGMKSLCFTFSNHPFNFILGRTDDDPDGVKLICSEEEKVSLIKEMGFDILVNIPFNEKIMTMSSDSFFNDIVLGKLNAGCVSVGFNYSYGARAGGNAKTLRQECDNAGIKVNIHDAVMLNDQVVSSTLIRNMISRGDMESVKDYLGRSLKFKGKVEHGKHIGSDKGFPTANISPGRERLLPPFGVYFTRIITDGKEYKAVSNIGVKPTIEGERKASIESYIFDFEGDLYGREITVILDHFSREEVKFASKNELFEQIAKDCDNARVFHR